ncbi:MAG TPA: hypothetical protein VNK95_00155 [Caldilineaceae bacterium]|nr:hypothetical protein [Caldilineaceae bacterium]
MAPFPPPGQYPAQPPLAATTTASTSDLMALPPLPSALTYRYVATIGESEVPYFPDGRLNRPIGLTTSGTDVWVAEYEGHRLLKYNAAGALVQEIGRVGQDHTADGQALYGVSDAALDGAGNLWVADESIGYVVQFDAAGTAIKSMGTTWNCGNSNDDFCHPAGIAFDDSGRLYVSDGASPWTEDHGNHRIQVFTPDGSYLTTIGTTGVAGSGPLEFHGPRRIALAGTTLYVADAGNHRVQILDVTNPTAPLLLGTLGVTGAPGNDNTHLSHPSGVAVDAQYIYVADTWNNRVQVFRRDTRAYVATVGTGWGSENDQFWGPTDVAVDAAGTLYVADFDNFRVQVFSAQRRYVRTLGVTREPYRTDARHLNNPWDVAIAEDGSFYVTEYQGNRLIKFGPGGTPLWSVGQAGMYGGWNGENDLLNYPAGIALYGNTVAVADRYNHRVQVFDAAGGYLRTLGTAGQSGSDNAHFSAPAGLNFGPDGALYVADTDNHRIQVFDAALTYRATLGVSGVPGNDNAHFQNPHDVAVDSDGTLYVADSGNRRIQVFNAQHQYLRTLGTTGVEGNEYGQFREPSGLAIDSHHRLLVADTWNSRIQVFDQSGAFLTSIGGRATTLLGGMWGPRGIAVDANGVLYVANTWNSHRIDLFAPGVPGWAQRNLNGFGSPRTPGVASLEVFNGRLYAGTRDHSGTGARRILRLDDGPNGPSWTEVVGAGFGRIANVYISELTAWNGHLYAGTQNWRPDEDRSDGGEIWRSADGQNWTPVMTGGFGDAHNFEITTFTPYSDTLLAAAWNDGTGAQIWQSNNGADWVRVAENGLGNPTNQAVLVMVPFNGHLYAGTHIYDPDGEVGCELWRSATGADWTQVVTGGLGGPDCYAVQSLAAFGDSLYAGTGVYDEGEQRYPGGQIWRCAAASGCDALADWEAVIQPGFGKPENLAIPALVVVDGRLYATTFNSVTGMEVWRTSDGTNWEPVGLGGFGDLHNVSAWWQKGVLAWEDTLWIGTSNSAGGGEVWQYQPERSALVIADPTQAQMLTHMRPDGSQIQVNLPAGALNEPATLVLIGAGGPAAPKGFAAVGDPFSLDLIVNGQVQSGYAFSDGMPVEVVITYTEAQVQFLDESQLVLMVWNPATRQWEEAACGPVVHVPESNRLTAPICHLSRFGLFTPVEQTWLPLLAR